MAIFSIICQSDLVYSFLYWKEMGGTILYINIDAASMTLLDIIFIPLSKVSVNTFFEPEDGFGYNIYNANE